MSCTLRRRPKASCMLKVIRTRRRRDRWAEARRPIRTPFALLRPRDLMPQEADLAAVAEATTVRS
jgi:hypothetical protein